MKSLHTSLAAILCGIVMHAQWTYDPANPIIVSNATNTQAGSQVLDDGNNGVFVFWRDSRTLNTSTDVYGQHYDQNGLALWEEGGREIINYASNISSISVARNPQDNTIVIGTIASFSSFQDTLKVRAVDVEGTPLWANDLVVAQTDGCTGNYFLYIESFGIVSNSTDFALQLTATYCGGSNGNRIARFTSDGILTSPFNGEPEGNQNYIGARGIDRTYDGSDDVYLFHTDGNGSGAHARCMRIGADGDTIWAPLDVLEGTNGVNYQFGALSDENGIAVFFQSNGTNGSVDIFIRKLNADGTWAWNGDIIPICAAEGAQAAIDISQDNDYYYACWSDGRPGVTCGYSRIFAQKISKATGEIIWAQDGVEVFDQCTYIPYPKCIVRNDGKLIVMNESTTTGFNAQLLDENGMTQWTTTNVIANPEFNPFYAAYSLMKAGNKILVVWDKSFASGGSDGVYIANVKAPLTNVEQTLETCQAYLLNGQEYSEDGTYEIELPGDTLLTLHLTITPLIASATANQNTIVADNASGTYAWLNCDSGQIEAMGTNTFSPMTSGNYALIVELDGCTDTTECIPMTITGVEELKKHEYFSMYPNPGTNELNIVNDKGDDNVHIRMINNAGMIVSEKNYSSGRVQTIPTANIPTGMYIIEIITTASTQQLRWMKQ